MWRRILLTIAAMVASITLLAFYGQPQHSVISTGTLAHGNTLPLMGTAQDASTACEVTGTDGDASTELTSRLACANTGEIDTAGWSTVGVILGYDNDAGTSDVQMQCDESPDSGTTWATIARDNDASNTLLLYTPTWSVVASDGRLSLPPFEISGNRLRCRAWIDGSDSSDTVTFWVRVNSWVER